mmetsp:Transcript_24200/g.33106  ORF Transcript_24200/g.33106 Transcript_24200/m.33106 type:complete len:90 (+) Transcript_24200:322-591(+)
MPGCTKNSNRARAMADFRFFYNRDTRFYIIATSNFHNMLTWATGGVCDVRTELPAEEDDIEAAMHETGFSARVNRVFEKVKSRGVKNFR